ncbi:OmpA family protein [Sphingomonas sp. NBWT7]|uniref:OmpA family protein n=1 Tax=Sphingomonas sp. NBWT7 TaxID=2596913 RepID=UPI0016297091|nr:OmpA family protein [Sphingomonas sp. NBWT7]
MTMRMLTVSLAMLAAVPATAQRAPASTPSVAGYLCTFAGKCDDAADGAAVEQATRDAPETKGFRLARSGGGDTPVASARPTTTRRSSRIATIAPPRNRAAPARPAYSAGETRRANMGSSAALVAPRLAAVSGGRRADLMIGFELNSDRLTAVGRQSARVFAQSLLMPELRDKRFLIEGHTDERGGSGVNVPLSARRAQRVADFLVAQGVARDRLQTRGLGSSAPLPGQQSTDPANRRVEAELIS